MIDPSAAGSALASGGSVNQAAPDRHQVAAVRFVTLAVGVTLVLAGCGDGPSDVDGGGEPAVVAATEIDADWSLDAVALRDRVGDRVAYLCPPAGTVGRVWGTGPYTDDSSVCTAGVHAGVVGAAEGGRVVIEIEAGLASYASGSANGVDAKDWPDWPGSFVVVGSR